jgi:hypothetical protein
MSTRNQRWMDRHDRNRTAGPLHLYWAPIHCTRAPDHHSPTQRSDQDSESVGRIEATIDVYSQPTMNGSTVVALRALYISTEYLLTALAPPFVIRPLNEVVRTRHRDRSVVYSLSEIYLLTPAITLKLGRLQNIVWSIDH